MVVLFRGMSSTYREVRRAVNSGCLNQFAFSGWIVESNRKHRLVLFKSGHDVKESKGSAAVDGAFSFCPTMFALLEVVLIEHAHAVRAFLAVAERVEPVAVAQDHPPHLAP